jgi:hypothetical protein
MRGYTDDWLEKQLRRKFERYRLPGPKTVIYPDAVEGVPESMRALATGESIGRPMLALVDSPEHWTLLGTQAVLYHDGSVVIRVPLEEVQQVNAANMEQTPRESNQHLELIDRQQRTHTVWAPPGPEFFTFWSLLKWLSELPPRE